MSNDKNEWHPTDGSKGEPPKATRTPGPRLAISRETYERLKALAALTGIDMNAAFARALDQVISEMASAGAPNEVEPVPGEPAPPPAPTPSANPIKDREKEDVAEELAAGADPGDVAAAEQTNPLKMKTSIHRWAASESPPIKKKRAVEQPKKQPQVETQRRVAIRGRAQQQQGGRR